MAIELRDHFERVAPRLTALSQKPVLSAVSKVELEGGVYADIQRSDARRRALDALLRRFAVIDFNDKMATAYGAIVRDKGFSRRKIIDRMIAATALVEDIPLITLNSADFAEIDGLKLETWQIG